MSNEFSHAEATEFRALLESCDLTSLKGDDGDEHPFTHCMEVVVPAMEREGKGPSDPEKFCGWWKAEHRSAGGPGSGNFGHGGRPGEVGGSSSEGGSSDAGSIHTEVKWKQPVDKNGRPIPIKVTDLNEAVALVHEGKVVEVPSIKEAHTLVERLSEMAREAKAAGKEAKEYDLCQVSVAGTNLFCAESLRNEKYPHGVPRLEMPQLGGETVPGSLAESHLEEGRSEVDGSDHFRKHLEDMGLKVTDEKIPAAYLKASQRELVGTKVGGMMAAKEYDPARKPIFVSNDEYVIDGHHRWAAVLGRDAEDGKLGDSHMNVIRVDAPITEVLHIANEWANKYGIKQKGGPSKKSRAATSRMVHLLGATGQIRTARYQDEDYLVVPVIALMEGVIHAINAETPEYVPISCLACAPQGWNGRPLMYGHPQRNGRQISANDPHVLEANSFGTIFNARIQNKQLHMDAWINVAKAAKVGAQRLLERIRNQEMIEVSVGAFVVTEDRSGFHGSRPYKAVWKDVTPDHLAFLPSGVGACSNAMGCGTPRAAAAHHLIVDQEIRTLSAADYEQRVKGTTPMATLVERVRGFFRELGGPGSGNFGHSGRPGEIGGSLSEGSGDGIESGVGRAGVEGSKLKSTKTGLQAEIVSAGKDAGFRVHDPSDPRSSHKYFKSYDEASAHAKAYVKGDVLMKGGERSVDAKERLIRSHVEKEMSDRAQATKDYLEFRQKSGLKDDEPAGSRVRVKASALRPGDTVHRLGDGKGNYDNSKKVESVRREGNLVHVKFEGDKEEQTQGHSNGLTVTRKSAHEKKGKKLRNSAEAVLTVCQEIGEHYEAMQDQLSELVTAGKTELDDARVEAIRSLCLLSQDFANSILTTLADESCSACGHDDEHTEESCLAKDCDCKENRAAAGARHSSSDRRIIQDVHDHAVNLGAECPEPKTLAEGDEMTNYEKALKKITSTDGRYTVAAAAQEYGLSAAETQELEGQATSLRTAAGGGMTKDQRTETITALCGDKHSGFTSADVKMLEGATDERLDQFRVAAAARKVEVEGKETAEAEAKQRAAAVAAQPAVLTEEQVMAVLPARMKTLLERAEQAETAARVDLVAKLKVAQDGYSESELAAMSLDGLERLAKVARIDITPVQASFAGRGIPRDLATAKDDVYANPPDSYADALKTLRAQNDGVTQTQ